MRCRLTGRSGAEIAEGWSDAEEVGTDVEAAVLEEGSEGQALRCLRVRYASQDGLEAQEAQEAQEVSDGLQDGLRPFVDPSRVRRQ